MKEDIQLIHIRLPKPLLKRIDHYAVGRNIYRAEAVAELCQMALGDLDFALQEARKEKQP